MQNSLIKEKWYLDKEKFVQNIKKYCELKGIKPTVACRESGVGTSFINNIEGRGQTPSVEKVQQMAAYLGVTTSELLGEEDPCAEGPAQPYLVMRYNALSPENQEKVMAFIEFLVVQEDKKTCPNRTRKTGEFRGWGKSPPLTSLFKHDTLIMH